MKGGDDKHNISQLKSVTQSIIGEDTVLIKDDYRQEVYEN